LFAEEREQVGSEFRYEPGARRLANVMDKIGGAVRAGRGYSLMVSGVERRQLDEQGFLALENFIEPAFRLALCERLEELFTQEGEQAGSEFRYEPGARRLANVVDKGALFDRVIGDARVLALVGAVIAERFKLSSLNARSPLPYFDRGQPLHADTGAVADERGYWVANTVWMLDDFTTENGATRVVPGSHRWRKLPQEALEDPSARHPEEVLVTGKAGTVVVMNAHLWHGGTPNRTGGRRLCLHAFYTRWDKAQQQYQKASLSEETQRRLSPALRELLALDDPLNDALCARETRVSGFLR
jgi:hypothetical protein